MKSKPSCVGQRFGMLVVVGKSNTQPRASMKAFGWELLCDCSRLIVKVRGDFDKPNGIKSCGCSSTLLKKKNAGLKAEDLQGRRFGELVVTRTCKGWNTESTRIRASNECECDCGAIVWRTSAQLKKSAFLNCRASHHLIGPKFPPMPSPMPDRVSGLIEKYWYLVEGLRHQRVRADIQDEKMKRLIRASWIIAYRELKGEFLSPEYIRNYLFKWLRNAGKDVICESIKLRKGEYNGIVRNLTGSEMTNPTSYYDAVQAQAQTQQEALLSKPKRKPKRRSFKRR